MRRILLAFALLSVILVSSAQILPDTPKHEVRAVWLTTLGGLDWPKVRATDAESRRRQQEDLCAILDRLQRDGINMVYLQTRIRGTVIYPSEIEPWDGALAGRYDMSPGYDPLAFAIEECHRRGMECHAWLVTIPAFKTVNAKALGRRSLLHTHPKLLFRQNDMYYLDPAQQGTADYLESLCNEIVANYDVDGVHLDYIRYPENTRNDRQQWRRDNITRIVRQLYHAVKSRKPWLKVSCSPVGKYRDVSRYSAKGWNAYHAVHQDAVLWMKEGVMDMISPMMYFKDDNFYPFCADWQEQSHSKVIAPGLSIYFLSPRERNWSLTDVTRELCFIRSLGMGGAAFFRTQFLLDNVKGLEDWLRDCFYCYPAMVPPTQENALYESGLVTCNAPERYAVYASREYPVDTSKAANLVRVFWGKPDYNLLAAWLWGMNIAIRKLDAWGRELPETFYESTPYNTTGAMRKVIRP